MVVSCKGVVELEELDIKRSELRTPGVHENQTHKHIYIYIYIRIHVFIYVCMYHIAFCLNAWRPRGRGPAGPANMCIYIYINKQSSTIHRYSWFKSIPHNGTQSYL